MKKLRTKGSFILKDKERFFKVIAVKPVGSNRYAFDCRDLESKSNIVLTFTMSGLIEALNKASQFMKRPEDMLLFDLDNDGLWKVIPKEQYEKIAK